MLPDVSDVQDNKAQTIQRSLQQYSVVDVKQTQR